MATDLDKQLKKQVDAFKQIVTLRSAVSSLQRELIDLKRRALVNVQKQQERDAIATSKREREEITQCSDIFELLNLAKKKFVEFDTNRSGYLDGDEMLVLADWIWSVFSLDGSKVRQTDTIRAKNRLLTKFDSNSDGKLDFEEFALWFLETWNSLKKTGTVQDDFNDVNEWRDPTPMLHYYSNDRYSRIRSKKSPMSSPRRPNSKQPYSSSFTRSPSTGYKSKASPLYSSSPLARNQMQKRDMSKLRKAPWRVLLKYREPARNCIQLFLRFDRSGKNILSETSIRDILDRCGVRQEKMDTVVKAFVKKFGENGSQISLEKFVETLPPKADERQLYLLVLDVLEDLKMKGR